MGWKKMEGRIDTERGEKRKVGEKRKKRRKREVEKKKKEKRRKGEKGGRGWKRRGRGRTRDSSEASL